MKISGSNSNPNSAEVQGATATGTGAPTAASTALPAPGTPTDRVQLMALSSYLAAALSGSPAHAAKLAGLASEVSNGQYHVDASAVSGSIIQHRVEFGGSAYGGLNT